MKKCNFVFIVYLFIFLPINAQIKYVRTDNTGDYNCNGVNDEVEINQALDFVSTDPNFTTVYLDGHFTISEPIFISSNTILTGDVSSVLKLEDYVNWNIGNKPMIAQKNRVEHWSAWGSYGDDISNVEIYGFEINVGQQAEPTGNTFIPLVHFCYPHNVSIHDMLLKNSRWDIIRFTSSGGVNSDTSQDANNSKVYNNTIVNSGHEGIAFVGLTNFEVYNNTIFRTRTNSGIRVKDSNNFSIHHNHIGNSLGNSSSGYAGIIVENYHIGINNAEIYNNIIYGKNGGIHLNNVRETDWTTYNKETRRDVHIHHNRIFKVKDMLSALQESLDGGIKINGFHHTLIEHNIIDGGTTDGVVFEGNAGFDTGYETFVRNNIIINNSAYGINNKSPVTHTFIANNNLVYNNTLGNYNNVISNNDLNVNPLFFGANNTLNKWHHIVASYNDTTEIFTIYVDGEKKIAEVVNGFGNIGVNTHNLFVGVFRGTSHWYKGNMDELAIWNKALTEVQINSLYNNGIPINISGSLTTDLQAYFKMNNNWNDSSVNSYNSEGATATFTTNALDGSYSGVFNNTGVQYPNTLSTTNGMTISVWVNRTDLNGEYQTILNKGSQSSNNHIWLYFRNEAVVLELGNGSQRKAVEANVLDPEDIDYHLKSVYGRWNGSSWINDAVTSSCIDAGDVTSDFSLESSPNGGIVNIGLYGNTIEASKSEILSVTEFDALKNSLYPNPTTGKLFIGDVIENYKYQIYAQNGILIKTGSIKSSTLDLSEFDSGIYFIKLYNTSAEKSMINKIIKN